MKKILKSIIYLLCVGVLLGGCRKMNVQYYEISNTTDSVGINAFQYLAQQGGRYDSMLKAVNRVVGLKSIMSNNEVTIFAIPNSCFTIGLQNLNKARARLTPPKDPLYINTLDVDQLDTLLCRYLIQGEFNTDTISQLNDGLTVESVRYDYLMQIQEGRNNSTGYADGGSEYLIFSDRNESIFSRYWVGTKTIKLNIKTKNAYIHILSPEHDFGFGQIVERMVDNK